GWLEDRQFGRLRTTENLADVRAGLAIGIFEVGSVACQTASRDVLAGIVDRRKRMARGQPDEMKALTLEEWIVADEERPRSFLNEGGKGPFDFDFAAGVEDVDLLADSTRRRLQVSRPGLGIWVVRV